MSPTSRASLRAQPAASRRSTESPCCLSFMSSGGGIRSLAPGMSQRPSRRPWKRASSASHVRRGMRSFLRRTRGGRSIRTSPSVTMASSQVNRDRSRIPVGPRYAGVAAFGGAIYVAGGVTPTGSSAAVYRVDVRAGRVTRIGTLPRANAHAPLVAAGRELWLVGGDGSRDILRIDPVTGTVTVAARLPRALVDAAAVALPDGRVVVLGGE